MNLLALVPPEVRAAYDLMTQEFAPLELSKELEPVLGQISSISVRRRGRAGAPSSPRRPACPLSTAVGAPTVCSARTLWRAGRETATPGAERARDLNPLHPAPSPPQSPMSPASPLKDLSMSDYVPALRNAAVVRMVKQLSEVYSTMRISELCKVGQLRAVSAHTARPETSGPGLCAAEAGSGASPTCRRRPLCWRADPSVQTPCAAPLSPPRQLIPGMTFNEAEAQLVDAVKYGFISMRIDHRNGTLQFGGQQLESERVRAHLSNLARRLAAAGAMIDPRPTGRAEDARRAALSLCRQHMESEHKRLLARKLLIEKRKEQQEAALLEAEREEERKRQQVRARGPRGGFWPRVQGSFIACILRRARLGGSALPTPPPPRTLVPKPATPVNTVHPHPRLARPATPPRTPPTPTPPPRRPPARRSCLRSAAAAMRRRGARRSASSASWRSRSRRRPRRCWSRPRRARRRAGWCSRRARRSTRPRS